MINYEDLEAWVIKANPQGLTPEKQALLDKAGESACNGIVSSAYAKMLLGEAKEKEIRTKRILYKKSH